MRDNSGKNREFEGADLESAIELAARGMGIPASEVDYRIIEQGRRGLFGIGAKNVRIRVMPPIDDEIPDPEKRSRKPRRPRNKRTADRQAPPADAAPADAATNAPGDRAAKPAGGGGQDGDETPSRRRRSRNRRRRGSRRGRQGDRGELEAANRGDDAEKTRAPAAEGSKESGRPPKREGGRRRSRSRSRSRRSSRDDAPHATDSPRTPATPEQIAAVKKTLDEMIALIGLEIAATPDEGASGVRLELDGADRKALLERDGELIGALQFVLNRMSRRAWPGAGRIQLGCNGQRTRRDHDLVGIVQGAIDELERTGEPQQLREMNAYERRLVHITVRKMRGFDSSSEGDGPLKCVRIFKVDASDARHDGVAEPDARADEADTVDAVEETEPASDVRDAGELGDRQA